MSGKGKAVTLGALQQVLQYQEDVRQVAQNLQNLEEAITRQSNILVEAESCDSALPSLPEQRENLMAEIAIGKGDKSKVAELDRGIAAEIQRLDDRKASSAQSVSDAKSALAGLHRKLETAKKEQDELENARPEILHLYLMSEAEQIGKEYVQAARVVIDKHRQLVVIEQLMTARNRAHVIQAGRGATLTFPHFNLQACKGLEISSYPGQLAEAPNSYRDPVAFDAATRKETERIKALGVEII